MTGIGDNSGEAPAGFAAEQLRSLIERVERLEEEIKALNSDKSDVFAEAKSNGFNVAAMKELLKIRREDAANPGKRKEKDADVELYARALGMSL